jgi:pilus assembly protein CpaB
VVNLLVTPEQAQVLALASNQTHIQLVLRNPLDTKIDPVEGSAMTNIFQDVAKTPVKAHLSGHVNKPVKPAPQMFSVVVINGAQRTEEKFATPEGKQ